MFTPDCCYASQGQAKKDIAVKLFIHAHDVISWEFEMGGAKKKSIISMDKAQKTRDKDQSAPQAKKPAKKVEKKIAGIDLPFDPNSKEFLGELKRINAVTPYSLASKYSLRISVVKDLLEDLEKKGVLRFVSGGSRLKIYTLANP
jgi:small subunit ribosomal protein S25e